MVINSPFGLADTHCHLNFGEFDNDRELVIDHAHKNGIIRILIPGIDIATSISAISHARKYSIIYASVGVHPNSAGTWTNDSVTELKRLAIGPKVVAIGEIGLDYYRGYTLKQMQHIILNAQLQIAYDLQLPVIIHNRDASADLLDIIQDWHQSLLREGSKLAKNPGVMHSFSSNMNFAERISALGFKIGITGPVTFKNASLLREVVKNLDLTNLLLETDSPYLAPHPNRGKRNEPSNVKIIAEKIAEIKDRSITDVAKVTTTSANMLFNWRVSH